MSQRTAGKLGSRLLHDAEFDAYVEEALKIERNRIAADLHDGVSQELLAVRMGLEAIAIRSNDPELCLDLERWTQRLGEACENLRRTYSNLLPDVCDRGLESLLRSIVSDSPVPCYLSVFGDLTTLPAALQEIVLRIVQESVQNVWKHADASRIDLSIQLDRGLSLSIKDDGKGITDDDKMSRGLGLNNIRTRVCGSGGIFEIRPAMDSGTLVTAIWERM